MYFVTNKRTAVKKDKATCYAQKVQQVDQLICIRQRGENHPDGKQRKTLRFKATQFFMWRHAHHFDPSDCPYHVVRVNLSQ